MVALKSAVNGETKLEIIPEESPVGDSQSNGLVEGAVKIIQGLARSQIDAVEGRCGIKVPKESAVVPWLVRHS